MTNFTTESYAVTSTTEPLENLIFLIVMVVMSIVLVGLLMSVVLLSIRLHIKRRKAQSKKNQKEMATIECIESEIEEESSPNEGNKTLIALEGFMTYISENKESGVIAEEYQSIPFEWAKSYRDALVDYNFPKNRYTNIFPYDENRVLLDGEEDEDETYINASFVDGYNGEKAFIAAQGPTYDTIDDFWKMIWQQKCSRIVMLTKLVEGGKRKCEQYWPDYGQPEIFEEICVELTNEEQFADFVIRNLFLYKGEESMTVTQLQFLRWPDKNVPEHAFPLVNFWRKVRGYDSEDSQAPIVVHCSAGIGRTGAFIAIDIVIHQAQTEGKVDIFTTTCKLRQQRMGMIQTKLQYEFIHDAVQEIIQCGNTIVPCDHLSPLLSGFVFANERIISEFETLNRFRPEQEEDMRHSVDSGKGDDENDYENIFWNNYRDKILYLDSYRLPSSVLVLPSPEEDNIQDFWKIVYDHMCNIVVTLHNKDVFFEACSSGTMDIGHLTVEFLTTSNSMSPLFPQIILTEFMLTSSRKGSKPFKVRQLSFESEESDADLPESQKLYELILAVDRYTDFKGDHILVNCLDGVVRSGIFCAALYGYQIMKYEKQLDMFTAVRQCYIKNPNFISSLDEYRHLFLASEHILKSHAGL